MGKKFLKTGRRPSGTQESFFHIIIMEELQFREPRELASLIEITEEFSKNIKKGFSTQLDFSRIKETSSNRSLISLLTLLSSYCIDLNYSLDVSRNNIRYRGHVPVLIDPFYSELKRV